MAIYGYDIESGEVLAEMDEEIRMCRESESSLQVIGYHVDDKFKDLGGLDVDLDYDNWPAFTGALAEIKQALVLCHTGASTASEALRGRGAADRDFQSYAFLCFCSDGCADPGGFSPYIHFISYRVTPYDEEARTSFVGLIKRWRSFRVMPTKDEVVALWAMIDPADDANRVARLRALDRVLREGATGYDQYQALVEQHCGRLMSYEDLSRYYFDECKKVDIKKN